MYVYENKKIILTKPDIYKEIYMFKIISELKKIFIDYLKNISCDYPSLKRILDKNSTKIDELIQRWCWHQYNLDDSEHNVIPYVKSGNYSWERFIYDLKYITNLKELHDFDKRKDFDRFKKRLHTFLSVEYSKYKQLNNKKITIEKITNLDSLTDNELDSSPCTNESYNEKLILKCTIDNDSIYKLILYNKVYYKLKYKLLKTRKYLDIIDDTISIDSQINEIIFCLYLRYSYLDSKNQQLAIIEDIKNMFAMYNVNFELFGSGINTFSDNYCSLFYDLEVFFGSQGNFFDFKPIKGIYWCNPPYDYTIMTNVGKYFNTLLNQNKDVIFLITIPIWDELTQKFVEKQQNSVIDHNKSIPQENFKDFELYYLLKPYIKKELIIPKNRIPYFNHRRDIHIYAVNSYLLLVYNDNINPDLIDTVNNLHKCFDTIHSLEKNNKFINKNNYTTGAFGDKSKKNSNDDISRNYIYDLININNTTINDD